MTHRGDSTLPIRLIAKTIKRWTPKSTMGNENPEKHGVIDRP